MRTDLGYYTLPVRDLKRGKAFYGAAFGWTFEPDGGHVVALDLPEAPYPLAGEPRDVLEDITRAGGFAIAQVGFADQPFAFELVPLELMKDNPDGLDLATPSIAFHVDDLAATHADLVARGVQATDVGDHEGTPSFAFSDPEGHWFAVTR